MLLRRGALPTSQTSYVPPLRNGDHLSQTEFHRRYEQYPEDVKFELIKGMVHMASPEGMPHSTYVVRLATVLGLYEAETTGVEAASDPTVILGDESEPQPDLLLRILPEYGGRTRMEEIYLAGPPELMIEIAYSSVAIDLHEKREDYQQNGIYEYVVVCVQEEEVYWFDLVGGRTKKLPADGVVRTKQFPGLWIDTKALLAGDRKRLLRTARAGLNSPEYARFVQRLEAAAKRKNRK